MNATGILLRDRTMIMSTIVCLLGFGGFFLWSVTAPLAEGVTVFGQVVVDGERKVVQHLEGGIIERIEVREGDDVEAGDPLLVLTDVAAIAGRAEVSQDLLNAKASVARLDALMGQRDSFDFPQELADEVSAARLADIRIKQNALFEQQRSALTADVAVLTSRQQGLRESIRNRDVQIDSTLRSLEIVRDDLARKREFLEDRLITANQVTALEREEATLEGDLARLRTEQNQATSQIAETGRQISQARARFLERVSSELVDARSQVSQLEERLTTVRDVVNRSIITAPQSGKILNMAFSTPGGVVGPGEPILEIVPSYEGLIATVQLRPTDRDNVYEGLAVTTRLSGLKGWTSPNLPGEVTQVSADLKTSPDGSYSFYEARLVVDTDPLNDSGVEITPGMPVEAFVSSGETRTLMAYLIEPIEATFRRGARS